MTETRTEGFDDFLDAVEAGEPYYLEGPEGDGWLPPRRVDPTTGSDELTEQPLPETGTVVTYTRTHVAAPEFAEDAPYVVAIAEFGPVRITGQLQGVEAEAVDVGRAVEIDVERSETTDERVVVFRPA